MYKLSREWNKLVLSIALFFIHRVWDMTKRNEQLINDTVDGVEYLKRFLGGSS